MVRVALALAVESAKLGIQLAPGWVDDPYGVRNRFGPMLDQSVQAVLAEMGSTVSYVDEGIGFGGLVLIVVLVR